MMACDVWRVEVQVDDTVPTETLDRVRVEFEVAVNRFASDVSARLTHELRPTTVVVTVAVTSTDASPLAS